MNFSDKKLSENIFIKVNILGSRLSSLNKEPAHREALKITKYINSAEGRIYVAGVAAIR